MSDGVAATAGNLAELVAGTARVGGARTAVVLTRHSWTWQQVDDQVSAFAAAARSRGVAAGDRVGIVLDNSVEFVVAYFGTLRAGAVAVPLNTMYTTVELVSRLRDAAVRLLVCDRPALERIRPLRAELPGLVTTVVVSGRGGVEVSTWKSFLAEGAAVAEDVRRGGEDLALLLYTSGTTAAPKAAMLTHRALAANLEQLCRLDIPVMTPDDVVLVLPPLFHVYGLNAGLGLAARVGATLVFTERFEPAATLKLIRERRVTCVVGAPTAFAAWSGLAGLRDAFTTARLVVSGGAPLPPELAERFAAASGRPVHQGYGLTETAPVLSTTLVGGTPKPGSIGRPLPGVELRLEDAQGSEVADDDPGEIVVRGANLFSGYWPDGAGGPDQAGWFHTGDVAYADEDGDLFLVDRLRDLIIVNGFNVYPQEVEQVLAAHPEVAEAAVVGAPDPYSGETVRAYVVPRPGSRPSAEALIEHAAATLARFKCPTSVEFRTHLPHSLAGEVAKRRLRAERPAEDDGG